MIQIITFDANLGLCVVLAVGVGGLGLVGTGVSSLNLDIRRVVFISGTDIDIS